jgi:hypothetical protein
MYIVISNLPRTLFTFTSYHSLNIETKKQFESAEAFVTVFTGTFASCLAQTPTSGATEIGLDLVIDMHEMLIVIIRSVHSTFFLFLLITFTCLGHRPNNNFSAGLIELVFR